MPEFPAKLTKSINKINYGAHEIQPVYNTPVLTVNGILNVCSKCLSFHPTQSSLQKHMEDCVVPFKPIYEEGEFKISRITPLKTKQNLCLLSQIFLKTKTVYFEVKNYDFFIVYQKEIYGYFSRYKGGDYSLCCFMVFPCFQKEGWGTILLDYSQIKDLKDGNAKNIESVDGYDFREGSSSSEGTAMIDPKGAEKPYSKKAILCFRKYWKYKVIGAKNIRQIAHKRNIPIDDAILGLELQRFNFNKWKLEGIVDVKKPRLLSKKVYRKRRLSE